MNAYLAHWRIALREEWRYFFSDGFWAGSLTLIFSILLVFFYQATGRSEFFGAFTWAMIAWYLIAAQFLVGFKSNFVTNISEQVTDGSIASRMSKPYNLPFALLTEHAGGVFVGSLAAIIFIVPFGILVAGTEALSIASVIVFLIAAALAVIIDFGISISIGLLAFWVEDARPYYWIYSKVIFLLGGLFFPLVLFPDWLASIATLLPPAYMVYHPARLLVDFSWQAATKVLVGQIIWCAITLSVAMLTYRKAVRMVTMNGG